MKDIYLESTRIGPLLPSFSTNGTRESLGPVPYSFVPANKKGRKAGAWYLIIQFVHSNGSVSWSPTTFDKKVVPDDGNLIDDNVGLQVVNGSTQGQYPHSYTGEFQVDCPPEETKKLVIVGAVLGAVLGLSWILLAASCGLFRRKNSRLQAENRRLVKGKTAGGQDDIEEEGEDVLASSASEKKKAGKGYRLHPPPHSSSEEMADFAATFGLTGNGKGDDKFEDELDGALDDEKRDAALLSYAKERESSHRDDEMLKKAQAFIDPVWRGRLQQDKNITEEQWGRINSERGLARRVLSIHERWDEVSRMINEACPTLRIPHSSSASTSRSLPAWQKELRSTYFAAEEEANKISSIYMLDEEKDGVDISERAKRLDKAYVYFDSLCNRMHTLLAQDGRSESRIQVHVSQPDGDEKEEKEMGSDCDHIPMPVPALPFTEGEQQAGESSPPRYES